MYYNKYSDNMILKKEDFKRLEIPEGRSGIPPYCYDINSLKDKTRRNATAISMAMRAMSKQIEEIGPANVKTTISNYMKMLNKVYIAHKSLDINQFINRVSEDEFEDSIISELNLDVIVFVFEGIYAYLRGIQDSEIREKLYAIFNILKMLCKDAGIFTPTTKELEEMMNDPDGRLAIRYNLIATINVEDSDRKITMNGIPFYIRIKEIGKKKPEIKNINDVSWCYNVGEYKKLKQLSIDGRYKQ